MPKEIWKQAPNFEGCYEVSSFGRVRRVRPARNSFVGKILKLQTHKDGYVFVDLCQDSIKSKKLVSRLVCGAFHGPCPKGHECNHKNGDKSNNRPSNLEWVTPSANSKHKYRVLGYFVTDVNKLSPYAGLKGKDHPYAKRYVVTNPDGHEFEILGLKDFCRKNTLRQGCMSQLANKSGHSTYHRGWKCRHA